MKKSVLFSLFVAAMFSLSGYAQGKKQVTIKAGTIVPLESVSSVRASRVFKGETVDFRVTKDVIVDGINVIPIGTIAKGSVYERKCSSWWGTKGRLGIKVKYLTLANGENLYFASADIYIEGVNRTPLSVVRALIFWPCMFICGSKAEMPQGYEYEAPIASTTTIEL